MSTTTTSQDLGRQVSRDVRAPPASEREREAPSREAAKQGPRPRVPTTLGEATAVDSTTRGREKKDQKLSAGKSDGAKIPTESRGKDKKPVTKKEKKKKAKAGKAKDMMAAAADAIASTTKNPEIARMKQQAELARAEMAKLQAEIAVLDMEGIVEPDIAEIRTQIKTRIASLENEIELDKLELQKTQKAKEIADLKQDADLLATREKIAKTKLSLRRADDPENAALTDLEMEKSMTELKFQIRKNVCALKKLEVEEITFGNILLNHEVAESNFKCELELAPFKQSLAKRNLILDEIRMDARIDMEKLHELRTEVERLKLVQEISQMKREPSDLEKAKREHCDRMEREQLEAAQEALTVPEIFRMRGSKFTDNFDELREGVPTGLLSYLLPDKYMARTRTWRIAGTGNPLSGYVVDAPMVEPDHVSGYEDTINICELKPESIGAAVKRRLLSTLGPAVVSAALGLATKEALAPSSHIETRTVHSLFLGAFKIQEKVVVPDYPSPASVAKTLGVAAVGAGAIAVGMTLFNDIATMIKGAVLRGVVTDVMVPTTDSRPRDDVISNGKLLQDRLLKISLFVEITLLDGTKMLSFDPILFNLFNWTKSRFYAMGCLATDDNKQFQDIWISEHQYLTAVSRHSLVVTHFEQSRAVSRIHKLLEMNGAFTENHRLRNLTGDGIFSGTLRFASLMVTKDPYTSCKDF